MAEMFGNALAYEEMMGRWSARLAPEFARFAKVLDGGKVLDVGCGTGVLVRTVADMAPRCRIVGIEMQMDFSSFDDYWQPHLKGIAPQGAYVASLSAQGRDVLREGLRKRLLAGRLDGPFSLRAKALAVRGMVPNRQ